ncbi:MAG TPA: sulfotransferase family 2 domain-containing protein [Balneolaceae bacterium]|nr:sulfotransferase family 2 domain-containing protein [Balneolaceae bacterium]
MPASEIKRYTDPDVWNNYFKFCFERNPWDKFISWYWWKGGDEEYSTFREFINSGNAKPSGFELYTINSQIIVDEVYKYEELSAAMEDISKRLNLDEKLDLSKINAKGSINKSRKHYSELLSDYEREWISKVNAREIAFFDYEF